MTSRSKSTSRSTSRSTSTSRTSGWDDAGGAGWSRERTHCSTCYSGRAGGNWRVEAGAFRAARLKSRHRGREVHLRGLMGAREMAAGGAGCGRGRRAPGCRRRGGGPSSAAGRAGWERPAIRIGADRRGPAGGHGGTPVKEPGARSRSRRPAASRASPLPLPGTGRGLGARGTGLAAQTPPPPLGDRGLPRAFGAAASPTDWGRGKEARADRPPPETILRGITRFYGEMTRWNRLVRRIASGGGEGLNPDHSPRA